MPTEKEAPGEWLVRIALFAIALCCVVAAVLHAIYPNLIDQTTAMFLGLAAIVLIIREISEAEFFGMKFKTDRLKSVEKRIEALEATLQLPGRKEDGNPPPEAPPPPGEPAPDDAPPKLKPPAKLRGGKSRKTVVKQDADDPNKGAFGGLSKAKNRILEAEIEPVAGEASAACTVTFRVRSTDPDADPLTGEVEFHLHPSFGEWEKYPVDVEDGVAEDEITSWGAFTLGAVADEGRTRLELDLTRVKGGTKKFYAN